MNRAVLNRSTTRNGAPTGQRDAATLIDDSTKPKLPSVEGGSALEVLWVVASRLGVTCLGGPIAYLGYFRTEYVVKRR